MIIANKHITKLFKTDAIAIFIFVIIKYKEYKNDKILMNHEKIHLRQQLEMLFVLNWILYFLNWVFLFIIYLIAGLKIRNANMMAYRNVIFEKEAFDHENDFSYLKKRKIFGFLCYLKKKKMN